MLVTITLTQTIFLTTPHSKSSTMTETNTPSFLANAIILYFSKFSIIEPNPHSMK